MSFFERKEWEMAFCTNCGAKLEDGAKFCTNCGTKTGQPEENGYVPTEEPVKGEYIPPAENTYFSSAEEEKEAARKKKNRTILIVILAVAAVAIGLIVVMVSLLFKLSKQIIDGGYTGKPESSEYSGEEFVSSTTQLKENSLWYGFAEISNHSGKEGYEEGVYEVWGIIGTDDSGRTFFELYDNYDMENGPVLSYWISLSPYYAEAEIGEEDAWLLDIYLLEEDESYFSFVLDNGAIEVWYPYEFEGESFDFYFFLREEGAEWDEENDPYIP